MSVSLKCQYGLRALFELAKRKGNGPVRIQEIAGVQAIPEKYLENILSQLRRGGFVDSRRGKAGGFVLARLAEHITILEIVQFLDGPIYTFDCEGMAPIKKCPLGPECVFMPLWRRAREALESVYRETTLQDLLNAEATPHNFDI